MAGPSKQFGLLFPKKAQLSAPKKANIFGDDSDLDEDDGVDWVKKSLQAEGEKNRIKKQARIDAARALEEDPTIYQYDEIYSKIHVDPKVKKEEKKKEGPKYIGTLLQAAEKRKKEYELRIERMVQKEREAEGEMFKDKEKFVTASYRAKLEEMEKLEEEEKEMDRLEAIGDVTKQGDVSGFYRHLYQQKFDEKKIEIKKEKEEENEANDKTEKSKQSLDKDDSSVNDSSAEEDNKSKDSPKILTKMRKVKQYRKRVVEESESEPEVEKEEEKEEDKNSKEETRLETEKSGKESMKEESKKEEKSRKRSLTPEVKGNDKENEDKNKELQNGSSKIEKEEDEENPKRKRAERKVSIWQKRTVGPVLEAALERYYARKALRVSGS